MRRRAQIVLWSGVCVIILALLCAFGVPPILRSVLQSQLVKNLHRPATVESVKFNPFTLCLTIDGLSIREPDDSAVFVSFERLFVNAEIASVIKRGLVLSEVALTKPHVRIVRAEENRYNFSDMLPADDAQPAAADDETPGTPFLFSIANVQIIDGFVEFDDQPLQTVHRISDINVGLPLISNFEQYVDAFVQPTFSATIDGRPFSLNAQSKPFADSLETDLNLDFADLELAQYLTYAPAKLNFKMPSGRLNTQLKLRYIQNPGSINEIRIEGGLSLSDLVLTALDDSPLLGIPALTVSGIACSVDKHTLVIDDIALQGLRLSLAREKDGTLSLQKLIGAGDTVAAKAPVEEETDAEASWSVTVKNFKSEAAAIGFNDLLPAKAARFTIDNFNISLANISTAGTSPADINLAGRINNDAALAVTGTFALEPLSAKLAIDLSGLDIRFAQSYLPDTLLVGLNNGTLALKGAIDFSQPGDGDPSVTWQGDIRLKDFAASRRGAKEDLLKFASLELQSMRAGTAPLVLDITTVNLSGLFLRTVVEPDGTFNLTSLSSAPEEAQKEPDPPPPKEPPPRINIGTIVLARGRIQFADKSITPRYSAELSDIAGRISGISNKPDSKADIRLNAKLNRHAPLAVTGTIRPLQEKLTADMKITFDNIELSPFTPYSGKFIGRMVDKGKLSLDLNYTIRENQLTSQNKFFIDQLTLGEKVDSPEATGLPVGLAISLLKNRKGEIDLDLPVSGSFDDPAFRVGKIILQTLVNLLEKAATSPFSLIGAMIPGGGDISTLTFACGTSQLDDEGRKKLDVIAGLLKDKEGLRLEIQGRGSKEPDMDGLRRERMLLRMKQQKFGDLGRREREGTTTEQVVINDDEFENYLWQAYKDGKFEKPGGVLGMTKRLSADEMERLMLANMPVDDDDVSELADQRALAAKEYLSETAGVAPERLFIVGARVEPSGSASDCAVAFTLK